MKDQGLGGSIVFVASKNALAASPGASAYCTAKAAELHLARCLALEGAPLGIRVNTVNPDAVLRGSKIWQGEWRKQRAASNKVAETELEEVYRQRSLLKRSVYPEDIAEAVYFFASDRSAKSTGNILNVDAGNAGASRADSVLLPACGEKVAGEARRMRGGAMTVDVRPAPHPDPLPASGEGE